MRLILITLVAISAVINFLTALGPDMGFDALWYHLVLPKLYLEHGAIYHVPGGLLYYSEMPRLAEMIFLGAMQLLGDIGPRLVVFASGIAAVVLTFKIARLYLPKLPSLLAATVFYVTPVVSWLSSSAYVDLPRTALEILALYLVLTGRFMLAGLAIGLAISTKTLALGSLLPLGIVILVVFRKWKSLFIFLGVALLVVTPWFLSAYLNTGFPFYPIGAGILDSHHALSLTNLNPLNFPGELWKVFMTPDDPLTPLMIILIPFIFIASWKDFAKYRPLAIYAGLSLVVWWLIPKTGGGRFILPYFPTLAILAVTVIENLRGAQIKKVLWLVALGLCCLNMVIRGVPLVRLTPYLLGQQSKEAYLCAHLDPQTSVFVDCDGKVGKIVGTDLVLVAGIHNLYYLDVPFVHDTWYRGEQVNYLLTTGDAKLFPASVLVYENTQLKYRLFKL